MRSAIDGKIYERFYVDKYGLAWIVAHEKVKTYDMVHGEDLVTVFSSQYCRVQRADAEYLNQLMLHWPIAYYQWWFQPGWLKTGLVGDSSLSWCCSIPIIKVFWTEENAIGDREVNSVGNFLGNLVGEEQKECLRHKGGRGGSFMG